MFQEAGVILNNIRSAYNVGSIMRTAEFFGVKRVWFVGVTPYPGLINDSRLPHIREKLDIQIKKVSLGAEDNLEMEYVDNLADLVKKLKDAGWHIVALEQDPKSIVLSQFKTNQAKMALLLGTEVTGLGKEELTLVGEIVEIPGLGKKESLNVSVAFGVAIANLVKN